MKRTSYLLEPKKAADLNKILVIVHPGSACGSADFNYGDRQVAKTERRRLAYGIESWNGGVIVLDGDLSEELQEARYRSLGTAVDSAVSRAKASGAVSLRRRAQDPAQMSVMKRLLRELDLPRESTSFVCTGAWLYPGDEGCVGSVKQVIERAGYPVVYSDYAMTD